MTNILGSLWIKGHWLKSGYFLQAWGDVGEGRAESWRTHAQGEEQLGFAVILEFSGSCFFEGNENAGD